MSAALPAWRHDATRQREQDLIFRGEQYARAVAMYVMKNNCALPTNVDDLVSRKFLRKKWKDPITGDDFVLLPGVAPGAVGGQPVGGGPSRGGPSGTAPAGQAQQPSRGVSAPAPSGGGRSMPSGASSLPGGSSLGPSGPSTSTGQSLSGGGIGGVMSKSTATSIMVYNGQQTYSGWQFVYQNALQKMGQSPRCGNQQGAPGAPTGRPGDGRGGPTPPGGVRGGGPGGPPPTGGRGRDGGPVPPPIGRGRGGGGS
jgi:hypothetical protein